MRNNNYLSQINFEINQLDSNNYYFALQQPSKSIQYNKVIYLMYTDSTQYGLVLLSYIVLYNTRLYSFFFIF